MRGLLRAALVFIAFASGACGVELPPAIRHEIAKSPPGVATVVMFTDFQCPFCRRTHAALAPVLRENEGRVRVVLRHVPLPRHPDARTAASASICVERLSPPSALAYAHALFTASDLGSDACEEAAAALGVDRTAFRACLASSATAERIAEDIALFDAVDGDGVPLLYIGKTRLEGAQSTGSLRSAINRAH